MDRFSEYRTMWVMVFFDLPTETKRQRHDADKFRKDIMSDGFVMFQFSIYIRHCASIENATAHRRRVRQLIPKYGKVGIMTITDKQFSEIELFYGQTYQPPEEPEQQLELF